MTDATDRLRPRPPAGRPRRASALLIVAAVLTLLAVYAPIRRMTFFFDDRVTILTNDKIHAPSLSAVLSENPFRAVPNLTFALQLIMYRPFLPVSAYSLRDAAPHLAQKWFPEPRRYQAVYTDPESGREVPVSLDAQRGFVFALPPAFPFRLANLLLHLTNALLLGVILRKLFPAEPVAAGLAAAAFLLHPLATETVNYVTARFTLLALTFSLAATAGHFSSMPAGRRSILFGGFFLLALFSKETAAVLPLLIFLLEMATGRFKPLTLLWLSASGVYLLLRLQWPIILSVVPGDILPWYRYLLVEQRVWWLYLLKIFFPIHLNFDYDIWRFPVLDSALLALNLVLITLAGYVMVKLFLEIRAMRPASAGKVELKEAKGKKEKRKRRREKETTIPEPPPFPVSSRVRAAVVLLMSVISLAPTSSFIPLNDLMKEDRPYVLLAIILPALVIGLARLNPRLVRGLVPALILFALLAFARNHAWRNELALNADSLRKSPGKPRAVYNYATSLKWAGRLEPALHWYQIAFSLDSSNADTMENIEVIKRELMKKAAEGSNQ